MRNKGLPQAQFPEHVDHRLHGGLICHRYGGHVQYAVEWQAGGPGLWLYGAREYHRRLAGDAFHCATSVSCSLVKRCY